MAVVLAWMLRLQKGRMRLIELGGMLVQVYLIAMWNASL